MEIRQLETFVHVAQLQSFSRAAEVLGYSQSAITVQIRLLENELETRLFDRTGKRVVLTSSGKEFLDHANRILYDINRARKSMNDDTELKNPLHIGTIESLCTAKLPSVLTKYRRLHPKVSLQVTIDTPEQLIRMMEHNGLDLIYILDTPRWDQNWIKVMEKAEPVVFVASADSDFAGKTLKLNDILEEPFFLTERNANYRQALISSWHLRSRPCHRCWRSATLPLSSVCWKKITDFPSFPIWLWSGISGKDVSLFFMWKMWRYPCTGRSFTIRISLRQERWKNLSDLRQSDLPHFLYGFTGEVYDMGSEQ